MTQHPRRPAAKPTPAKAAAASPTARHRPSRKAAPPAPTVTADTVEQAARIALDIAAGAGADATVRGSVPVPTAHQLDSGLVDYGMWVEMFTRTAPPPPPDEPFRRGRIWA